jgi:hypothetical protein
MKNYIYIIPAVINRIAFLLYAIAFFVWEFQFPTYKSYINAADEEEGIYIPTFAGSLFIIAGGFSFIFTIIYIFYHNELNS